MEIKDFGLVDTGRFVIRFDYHSRRFLSGGEVKFDHDICIDTKFVGGLFKSADIASGLFDPRVKMSRFEINESLCGAFHYSPVVSHVTMEAFRSLIMGNSHFCQSIACDYQKISGEIVVDQKFRSPKSYQMSVIFALKDHIQDVFSATMTDFRMSGLWLRHAGTAFRATMNDKEI